MAKLTFASQTQGTVHSAKVDPTTFGNSAAGHVPLSPATGDSKARTEATAEAGELQDPGQLNGSAENQKLKELKKNDHIIVDSYSRLSRQVWLYCFPLLWKGWNRRISEDSAMELPSDLQIASSGRKAEEIWQKLSQNNSTPSLRKALLHSSKPLLAKMLIVAFTGGVLNTIARPLLLRECIRLISLPYAENETKIVLYWAGLVVASFVEAWTQSAVMVKGYDEGYVFFIGFVTRLLCVKSLKIQVSDQSKGITNIFGNDVMRLQETWRLAGWFPIAVTSIFGGIAMLLYFAGIAAIGGIVCMFTLLACTRQISKWMRSAQTSALDFASQRVRILENIVESSKAVKLFSWEQPYLELLEAARQQEMHAIWKWRWYMIMSQQVGRLTPALSSASTVAVMVFTGKELVTEDIFAVIAVFLALRLSMVVLPLGLGSINTMLVSFDRIEDYLNLPDCAKRSILPDGNPNAVEIDDFSIAWANSTPQAEDEQKSDSVEDTSGTNEFSVVGSLTVPIGQTFAVIGEVGCGKSTLLSAIVGELAPTRGTVASANLIRYAPQQPQVICGTVLENIDLGRDFGEEALQEAVKAASLTYDLELLPGGIHAEIGERGVSLSGGQKQRVSLARTLYGIPAKALLVLDDPFAAVDPLVGKQMFENIVLAHKRRGGTVVVAINQAKLLPQFDKVVSIERGTITVNEAPLPVTKNRESMVSNESENREPPLPVVELPFALSTPVTQGSKEDAEAILLDEDRKVGIVSCAVGCGFIGDMGCSVIVAWILAGAAGYSFMATADFHLASWTTEEGLRNKEHLENMGIYVAFLGCFAICVVLSSRFSVVGTIRASKTLHHHCMSRLMRAPLFWWNGTPKGRIISRFSSDLGVVDQHLGNQLDNLCQVGFTVMAMFAVVIVVAPLMAIPIVVCLVLALMIFIVQDCTNAELKRIAVFANAPLISNIGECISMQRTAELAGAKEFFLARNDERTDDLNRMNFASGVLLSFTKLLVSELATIIAATSTAWLVFVDRTPGDSAVAMTYAISVPYFIGMCCQVLGVAKIMLTDVERLREYTVIPQEPEWHLPLDHDLQSWPKDGKIEFKNISLRYKSNLPLALHDVSFTVPGGSRMGIVGRTGSGKSTLVACLFRLHESEQGAVLLDDVNIFNIGLQSLRNCLIVVPQDPVLMAGTCHKNIDPFGTVSQEKLVEAVQMAGLASTERDAEEVLLRKIDSAGSNLSCGERQLLCLARAAVGTPTVLVLDEPTSSADPVTDAKLQIMMRSCFSCTSLCIAHRIPTVMDSDIVLVMADGKVSEIGSPTNLFQKPNGAFRSMCDLSGVEIAAD